MGGCFVQTAAGGLCSSRVSRLCALSLGGGFGSEGQRPKGRRCHSVLLARTQPRLKQRGDRPAHLPDPLCARPVPARPTHAMSSASAMHVHVHIPQDHPYVTHVHIPQYHPSPVHVHLCSPDGKWNPPPSGATFGEDYVSASDHLPTFYCACEGGDKKKVAGPVGGKGTDKKKVAKPVGGKGTAAGKKKAGKKKAGP